MFLRLVHFKLNAGDLSGFREHYESRVIPTLENTAGCRYAGFMQSAHHAENCISLTLWDSNDNAKAYESSGVYSKLLDGSRPFLSESSEYKVQLSADMTLEYVPVPQVPVVEAYSLAATSATLSNDQQKRGALWLRIVSLKIRPGKLEEFKHLYSERVVPALRQVKGCRYIYLTEGVKKQNEIISVTSWDSKEDAEQYERSGLFDKLLESMKHTLSELYQWKRSLGQEMTGTATSEDVTVEHYTVITGKSFK